MDEIDAKIWDILKRRSPVLLYSSDIEELISALRPIYNDRSQSAPPLKKVRHQRKKVEPPRGIASLERLLKVLDGEAVAAFIRSFYPEFPTWWYRFSAFDQIEFLQRLPSHGLKSGEAAFYLFAGGIVRLAEDGWDWEDLFRRTWGQVGPLPFLPEPAQQIAIWIVHEIEESKGWLPRLHRCRIEACRRWFIDRSPTWKTNPAKSCSPSHRARAGKLSPHPE
jgi:hypothetical protein